MTKRRIAAAIIALAASLGLGAGIAASAASTSHVSATHFWGHEPG